MGTASWSPKIDSPSSTSPHSTGVPVAVDIEAYGPEIRDEATSLLDAVKKRDAGLVRAILKRAKVDDVNGKESGALALAPLHHAAQNGDLDMVKLLTKFPGANVNIQDGIGRTALIIASRGGYSRIVFFLLQERANVLACTTGGFTCLHLAAFCGHEQVVNVLLHGNFQRKRKGKEDPSLASLPVPIRLALMEKKSTKEKFTALHMAVSCGHHHEAVVESLWSAYNSAVLEFYGIPSDSTEYQVDKKVWQEFLSRIRIFVNSENVEIDRDTIMETLALESFRQWPRTELADKHEGLVNVCVKLILYSNAKDFIGRTPLHYTVWETRCQLDIFLSVHSNFGYFCNLNAADIDGYTPLHLASKFGYTYRDCFLESQKFIRPNPAAKSNRRSREMAAQVRCHDETEAELLPRPQPPMWQEERNGVTPLHYAVEGEHEYAVRILLGHPDIAIFQSASDGQSPWTIAFPVNLAPSDVGKPTAIQRLIRSTSRDELNRLPYRRKLLQNLDLVADVAGRVSSSYFESLAFRKLAVQILLTFPEGFTEQKDEAASLKEKGQGSSWGDSHRPVGWVVHSGFTLLHLAVLEGFDDVLKSLLEVPMFKTFANDRDELAGQTPLHVAAGKGRVGAMKVLLNENSTRAAEVDKNDKTPLQIAIELYLGMLSSGKIYEEDPKPMEQLLMDRPEVQRQVERLYRDRQVYVDAANAILVGAALIASVTFAGWLQPPLGYTTYYQELSSYPAPPATFESFAAVEHHISIRVFWTFNSLSFFLAIATVSAGAGTILPATGYFIGEEVRIVRRWVVATSVLLSLSVLFVLGAFTAAGMAVLPPIHRYQTNMIITSSFGLLVCVVVLLAFFYKVYLIVWHRIKEKAMKSRDLRDWKKIENARKIYALGAIGKRGP